MKLEHPIIFSVSRRREQAFIVFKGTIFVKSVGFYRIGLFNAVVCNLGEGSGHLPAQVAQGKPSSARLAVDNPQTPIRVFLFTLFMQILLLKAS